MDRYQSYTRNSVIKRPRNNTNTNKNEEKNDQTNYLG